MAGWAPRRRANFDTQSQRYTHLRQFWDASYAELIDHPAIVPIVRELMCEEEGGLCGEEGGEQSDAGAASHRAAR